MSKTPSYLRVTRDGDVVQVDFVEKHILDEAIIRAIGLELAKLVDESARPRLVINFRNVEHLSSFALGTLITVNNKISAKDGQLRLCEIRPEIVQIFEITKLNKILRIEKTMATAKASLASGAKS